MESEGDESDTESKAEQQLYRSSSRSYAFSAAASLLVAAYSNYSITGANPQVSALSPAEGRLRMVQPAHPSHHTIRKALD